MLDAHNTELLIKLLMQQEGLRLKAYKDTRGILTIGVGRNIQDRGLSQNEALYLLNNDIIDTQNSLGAKWPFYSKLDDIRKIAMISLGFMGVDTLMGFRKMLAALENKDWHRASCELLDSDYAKELPARAMQLAYIFEVGKIKP